MNFRSMIVKNVDTSRYLVQALSKPHIELSCLVRDIFYDTVDYGKPEYVIGMFNTVNVSNHKRKRKVQMYTFILMLK